MSRREAITALWSFWSTVSARIDEGVRSRGLDDELVGAVNEHVSAIEKGLDWELGPGRASHHHLCLSGKGDPVMRSIAEQWLHHAPKPDAIWEYYASRQPRPKGGTVLEIPGHEIEIDKTICQVREDDDREVLDVGVFHPDFADAEEKLHRRVMFIALDTVLGEDDVERWLGIVNILSTAPEDRMPIQELRGRIRAFAERATGEKWVVLKGKHRDKAIFVSKNSALKRIDHLLLDMHVEIRIALATRREDGLTTSEEATVLNEMQDALFGSLGAEAVQVGRETHDGARTLHLHVMEGGPAATKIEAWKGLWPDYEIEVSIRSDPRWEVLRLWG